MFLQVIPHLVKVVPYVSTILLLDIHFIQTVLFIMRAGNAVEVYHFLQREDQYLKIVSFTETVQKIPIRSIFLKWSLLQYGYYIATLKVDGTSDTATMSSMKTLNSSILTTTTSTLPQTPPASTRATLKPSPTLTVLAQTSGHSSFRSRTSMSNPK